MVTVRYFAAAKAAAGVAQQQCAEADLATLISAIAAEHGEGLARVLAAASFLVDGVSWRDRTAPLPPDAVVDVLPPFAGG